MTKPHVHIHLYDRESLEHGGFADQEIWEQHDIFDSVEGEDQSPQYFYTTNVGKPRTIEVFTHQDEYEEYYQFSVSVENRVIEFRVMKEGQ